MSDEDKKLKEVVDELNDKVDQFAVSVKEDVKTSDEKVKKSADEIADETIKTIKDLIGQLVVKYDEITDSEKFKELTEAVGATTNMLIKEGKRKIKEVQESEELRQNWEQAKNSAINTGTKVVDSLKENEDLMETVHLVKGVTLNLAKRSADAIKSAYDDFASNPKVKEGIGKAKSVTLDAAGKAYGKLEKWLDEDNGSDDDTAPEDDNTDKQQ